MDTSKLEQAARRYRDAEAALDSARTDLQTEAVDFLRSTDERGVQAAVVRITGWSREHLRRLKEKAELEALRRRVDELSTAKKPSPAVDAPRQQVTETLPEGPAAEPPEHLGISPEVAALTYEQARTLFVEAETKHMQWGITQRRHVARVPSEWRFHAGVQAGVTAGHIGLSERPVSGEEKTG